MNNPWRQIKPNDYDAHMSHPHVAQTQMLNRIIKEQFGLIPRERLAASSAAILGITNGNGLEHVVPCGIAHVIGIDINKDFLGECGERYPEIKSRLHLFQLDLITEAQKAVEIISACDLIIANLLIKHIRLENFINVIKKLSKNGQIISCVIQINPDGTSVSQSGFEHVFDIISQQREEEKEDLIVPLMRENGFNLTNRFVYDLPNGKQFIRLDFIYAREAFTAQ